jgi:DNA-directed RNA polymerase sigma subunit (sigma70/sigma32)
MLLNKISKRTYTVDRSSIIYKKEIWDFPTSNDIDCANIDRDKLIKNHLRYAYWLATYYCPSHMPLSEFIGESCLGLVEEANKVNDPERMKRFTNLVKYRIGGKLKQLKWDESSPVKTTRTYREFFLKASRELEQLRKYYETENICLLDVYSRMDSVFINECIGLNPFEHISLEDAVGDDGETYNKTNLVADAPADPLLEAKYIEAKDKLLVILKKILTDMEFVVITESFGLLRTEPKTIAQITGVLGVSMKQVYSAYNSAIEKLRKEEVQDMLLVINEMDISRYTNFEEINKQFENKYLTVLSQDYKQDYEFKSLKGFEEHEVLYLKDNYKRLTVDQCLTYINNRRTDDKQLSNVHFRRLVAMLGLTQRGTWSKEEEDLITLYYGRISNEELADHLTKQNCFGKKFTPKMIVKKASRMKIKKQVS